jgi:adenylosuccinate synthase
MAVVAVIGAQWGDEGKGKIVDYLSKKMDIVVRFNGGPNAGHTIDNRYGRFALHLLPSGIFNPRALCLIGNGVALDLEVLIGEIEALTKKGISCQNLKISRLCHLILFWHLLMDEVQETSRERKIGTTKRGIGPVFSDKVGRFGLRVEDLFYPSRFKEKFFEIYSQRKDLIKKAALNRPHHYHFLFPEILVEKYLTLGKKIQPYVFPVEEILWEALEKNKKILLEGAQGTLLDPDFGTYPYVTSSCCTSAGACLGSGIPPTKIDEVIGVVKAYSTRVGEGPFPSEMPEDLAEFLRKKASEFGATTGRPRRIGWLDLFLIRYATQINGFTSLAITRIDNLTGLKTLKIYDRTKDALKIIEIGGWQNFPKNPKKLADLPFSARLYLEIIEKLTEIKIKYISTGPRREQMIVKEA